MEYFKDAHSVRLKGHKGRYLWADDDRRSVAQKKGKDSYGVIWRVELVPERNAIRLKSVYDLYLMASDYAFLLGATGKKVMQSFANKADSSLEWEPISAEDFVKLRTKGDKFLRANGGVPPYRNSVTHDVPVLVNQHVVYWEVEVVKKKEAAQSISLPASRMPSPKPAPLVRPDSPRPLRPQVDTSYDEESSVPQPLYTPRPRTRRHSAPAEDFFPAPDEYSSSPSERLSPIASPPRGRRGSSPPAESYRSPPRGRLPPASQSLKNPGKSEYDSSPSESSSLASSHQTSMPAPSRHRTAVSEVPTRFTANDDYDSSPSEPSPPRSRVSNLRIEDEEENEGRGRASPRTPNAKSPSDGRRIYYTIAEDDGEELDNEDNTFGSFVFKGHSLQELREQLQVETGIDEDIILCMRNMLTSKLYKMRLQLPPNKAPMSIVVVRQNSSFGRTLSTTSVRQR